MFGLTAQVIFELHTCWYFEGWQVSGDEGAHETREGWSDRRKENLCVMLEVIVSLALFLVCNGCCFLMAPQHFEPVNEDIQLLKIS